ncbi:MAG: sel1 repeat family protein [Magnetococcales bacterium]|nr:sel1 repeat family protein [Magnetococcales bacterium]
MQASRLWIILAVLACSIGSPLTSWAKELKEYQEEAEKGLAESQAALGILLATGGQGATTDLTQAQQWLEKAAQQGHARAQNALGDLLFSGKKDNKQPDTAKRDLFGSDSGANASDVKALEWYRKAAEQGLAEAQANLGMMYYLGIGTAEDEKEAFQWLKKAADQGLAEAQRNLSILYAKGHGVALNKEESAKWLQQSNANRNKKP